MGSWFACDHEPATEEGRKAVRRLAGWVLGLSLVAAAAMIGVAKWLRAIPEASLWLRAAVALLPLIPFSAMLLVLVRSMRRLDEMIIRIQFEALALTVLLSVLLAMGWGQLQKAGVLPLTEMSGAWPLIAFVYGGCIFAVSRRYR